MKEKILVLGNGGHAKSITDTIKCIGKYEIAGYIVNEEVIEADYHYPIIGKDKDLEKLYDSGIQKAVIGIGYLGRSNIREVLYKKLKKFGYELPIIIDPTAVISDNIIIDEGVFIGKGSIINTNAIIEKMCIINTGAIIEHECKIGAFSHVAVGAVVCGNANVESQVFIGANATIIQGIHIKEKSIIKAGEVITRSIL